MRKVLLTQTMRRTLLQDAEKMVCPRTLKESVNKAYDRTAPKLLVFIEKRFPASDMAVLNKYSETREQNNWSFRFDNGVVDQFNFITPILRPDGYSYNGSVLLATGETIWTRFEEWKDASKAFEAEKRKRIDAYSAVLRGSRYLEDVAQIWPEVVKYMPSPALPILLNPEQVALVRADLAEQKETA